jgi:thioredoxin-like negative regulator of GroEL
MSDAHERVRTLLFNVLFNDGRPADNADGRYLAARVEEIVDQFVEEVPDPQLLSTDSIQQWAAQRLAETAIARFKRRQDEMRAGILPMARGLQAALQVYRTRAEFEAWLKTSEYADFSEADLEALYKIGEHHEMAEEFLRTTTLVEPQEIWNAFKKRVEPPR